MIQYDLVLFRKVRLGSLYNIMNNERVTVYDDMISPEIHKDLYEWTQATHTLLTPSTNAEEMALRMAFRVKSPVKPIKNEFCI